MNRTIAIRGFTIFAILAVFAAVTGVASQVEIAEMIFLIGGSLAALMLFYASWTPKPAPVPIRVRSRR